MSRSKLPDEKVEEILKLAKTNLSYRKISEITGASLSAVASHIIKNKEKKYTNYGPKAAVENIRLIRGIREIFRAVQVGEEIEVAIKQSERLSDYDIHIATVDQKSRHVLHTTLDTGSRLSISDYQVLTNEIQIRRYVEC